MAQKQRLADKALPPVSSTVETDKLLAEVRIIATQGYAHGNKRRHSDRYTKFKKAAG